MNNSPNSYSEIISIKTTLCGESIAYSSKPGLPEWDRVPPSVHLLAKYVDVKSTDRILMLGAAHGALIVYISRKLSSGEIVIIDNNWIALTLANITARNNHLQNTTIEENIDLAPVFFNSFDLAIIGLPKGRNLAQRWIINANESLRTNGDLYISGANDLGIRSSIKDAESLIGSAQVLGFKKGHRVARIRKHQTNSVEPTWARKPGVSPGTWHKFEANVRGETMRIHSLPGIFSFNRVDEGTKLLLDTMDILQGEQVLDLGCGYGVIGLTAARLGAGQVTLVDNNLLATSAALKNVQTSKVDNANVIISDVLDAVSNQNFDLIVSNPPFHTGKDVNYLVTRAFIEQSWQALKDGGNLIMVANKFIPYQAVLREYFSSSECIAENTRYHVLKAAK